MTAWHRFWLIWAIVVLATFLAAESYALATNPKRTLSAAVWHIESYVPDQWVGLWSVGHYFVGGILIVFDVWLFCHFVLGWWR